MVTKARQGKVFFFKLTFIWIILAYYWFSDISKIVFSGLHLEKVFCCESSQPWGSSKMLDNYTQVPHWAPHLLAMKTRLLSLPAATWSLEGLCLQASLWEEQRAAEESSTLLYMTRSQMARSDSARLLTSEPHGPSSYVQCFYVGCGNVSSDTQACTESTVLT